MSPGRAADQAQGERALFRIFAEAAGLPIRPASIRSKQPPEPDLRCFVDGDGPVAFELGEVVNPALAEMTNQGLELRRYFARSYAELPEGHRAAIENNLGGPPAVFAAFADHTHPGRWRRAVPAILSVLVERAEHLVHGLEIPVWNIDSLSDVLIEMQVQRASSNRPGLWAGEMTPVIDRTVVLLQKKFGRSYQTSAPIELLAYYTSAPPSDDPAWRSTVADFIAAKLSASPFRRVWLFDYFQRRVVLVLPPHGAGPG
ncbi:MAG TPA: hypothetical protein VJX92_12695 [Methylomirabilota bacterium]|nr:hypothetical protein [Methylomirabilota bacterium]